MKKFILGLTLLLLVVMSAEAQKKKKKKEWQTDEFKFTASLSVGLVPIALSGLEYDDRGGYFLQDTASLVYNGVMHAGINVPFYRTDNWSVGAKLNAGIGVMRNLKAAEGLEGLIYDFPQFLYYRNYKNKFDYSFLLGYKYTHAGLPYQMALGGVEVAFNHHLSLRLYSGLNQYKYYRYFTDGRTEPAIKMREFGITLIRTL